MARLSSSNKHIVDILFTISLFFVFVISALLVVVFGANIYKSTVSQMDYQFNLGTSISYINTKLRQYDEIDRIEIGKTDFGADALVLKDSVGENIYETWIYSYEGTLRELLIKEGSEIVPSDGQEILDISQLDVEIVENNLIKISATDSEGNCEQLFIRQNTYVDKF